MNNTQLHVDTEAMATCISNIQTAISSMEEAINSYSTSADALGNSSFRGTVEENLQGIKTSYTNLIPKLEEIANAINSVKAEYIDRATAISGQAQGSGTPGGPTAQIN